MLREGVDGRVVPAPPALPEREPVVVALERRVVLDARPTLGLLAAGFAADRALGTSAAGVEPAAPGSAAAAAAGADWAAAAATGLGRGGVGPGPGPRGWGGGGGVAMALGCGAEGKTGLGDRGLSPQA